MFHCAGVAIQPTQFEVLPWGTPYGSVLPLSVFPSLLDMMEVADVEQISPGEARV